MPPTDVPVHPTQLYEAFALAVAAWFLVRWRRRHVADSIVLGRYLVLAGSIRFAIEFIRVNVRIVGPFTLAHLVSLALVIVGAGLMLAVAPVIRGRAGSFHLNRAGSQAGSP